MEVTLGLLADYANVSREGKLNVLGIFGVIYARAFPVTHPQMQIVMRFEAEPGEWGSTKNSEIILLDEDAHRVLSIGGEMTIPLGEPGATGCHRSRDDIV